MSRRLRGLMSHVPRLSYNECEIKILDPRLAEPASIPPARRAMKPLFVKRLPPHVQVVSGQSLVTTCQMRSAGCKPCFIKRLPSNMEVCQGNNVEMRCQDRVATEKNIGRMQQSLETKADIRGSMWKEF
ncbi:hypothetical protein LSAT2_007206 [Lamellibrachia satsuma]|nr:hypothetical protein LSAT2_007206 [Lamellibrachia satsuma]